MASTYRRSAGEPRRAGRRPPIRRRQGTPPYVLVIMIGVPLVLLGVVLAFKGSGEGSAPPPPQDDPNAEIMALGKQFQKLEDQTREAMRMNRETTKFKTQVKILKSSWSKWMDDYTKIFQGIKNPDGSWPEKFHHYSELKARAGQLRVDLIRVGNL